MSLLPLFTPFYHLSLFKELINLPDPQLREMLTPYFVDELLHSRLENMVEKRKTVQKSKKLGEEINKKGSG